MNSTVEMMNEIPESLYESLKSFLDSRPDWDQDRAVTAALSLFLVQNGKGDRSAARVYLDTLFQHPGKAEL